VPKHLVDRLLKIHGNCLAQQTLGLNGDTTFIALRLIPIENYQDGNEPHYRTTIAFTYPTKLDNVEPDKIKVDDDDNPASIVEHVKQMIQKLRPKCEMTDIMLELWELVPKTTPNDLENCNTFKTYNTIPRKKMQVLNPLSLNSWMKWTSSRVTLLGDAAHAMSPVLGLGANNAIRDADILSQALFKSSPENYISHIKEYENKMTILRSRATALQ
jgi:hypothetical protein